MLLVAMKKQVRQIVSDCVLILFVHVAVVGRKHLTGCPGVWRRSKQETASMIGYDMYALLCAMSTILQ